MNTRDLLQSENLRNQLGDAPRPGLFLLDVSTTHFVVVELVLLKALIGEGNPGLFISVDRPHHYMTHLLDMHRIGRDGLQFLNVMSRFSPSNGGSASKVDFFDGPGHIDELPKALKERLATERGLDLSKYQFALIDNVSILLTYNSPQAVEKFLRDFVHLLSGNMAVTLVIDRRKYPTLYQTALSLGGKELRLERHDGRVPESRETKTERPQMQGAE
ncbi:MAG: hypothetical protein AB9819_03615 [Methanomassiliicoccales archaeon]